MSQLIHCRCSKLKAKGHMVNAHNHQKVIHTIEKIGAGGGRSPNPKEVVLNLRLVHYRARN